MPCNEKTERTTCVCTIFAGVIVVTWSEWIPCQAKHTIHEDKREHNRVNATRLSETEISNIEKEMNRQQRNLLPFRILNTWLSVSTIYFVNSLSYITEMKLKPQCRARNENIQNDKFTLHEAENFSRWQCQSHRFRRTRRMQVALKKSRRDRGL